ncbi:helix-turn-helix domain-containing protein [Bacillus sp. B1-b2]|uniref:helix-turn-helix domain-containing protein n=1 Tax=Bacillus sp. B1-b2 TaxID=2653201 RepID=UPI0012615DF2|nr:XRE family transcriptional regulator [Bacillus sp. B1-b2]KAB7668947.1 ImmA/IrrE family metallo-endopeptidase [Bacillus sp. B1-b2]
MLERQFNGSRLREGRIYRGLTITDLANNLGVSKQMISKYENDKAVPTFESLLQISQLLRFPKEYFYEDSIEVKTGNTYFRSLLTTGKKEREMQHDRVKYLTIIRSLLEEYVDFPDLDVPDFTERDTENVEEIAERLRESWGLSDQPVKDIVYLLETKGFVISSLNLDKKSIDAFGSQHEVNGKQYYSIVLGNDKNSFYRRQFDVAHELGHKVLHDPYMNLDDLSKEEFKQIEQEANDFAAAFLLPKESFYRDVSIHPNDLMYYKTLKKRWCVSIGAMVMRAYKLGVISDGTYQYMQRSISQKGWRTKEPLDDIKDMRDPVSMKQAVELLIENNYITGDEFMYKLSDNYGLSLYREEVEKLLGLEEGYLKTQTSVYKDNIVSIKDKLDSKAKNKLS